MFGLGIPELVIILIVVLVIFGPKKLPQIGKSLGSAIRELRKSTVDDNSDKDKTDAKEKVETKKSEDIN
ncbi:MAG TPA: twin-arginine translocase TatA/TatE family subunit [Actinobacteria bacterium]|nr:twin-arginine translocase TatA/TatE family subunit [Actinomycetes bacterium]HEX21165.1 twin-arginine translocase TatA/TatE family subunit [Actinomycetota bacterium]